MKITVVGAGYVGLVSGACFAEFGVDVVCVDKDQEKIRKLKKGIIPIYEPGLEELVQKNVNEKRLFFETDISLSVKDSSAIFIAVGTPSRRGDGHADLTYVFEAAKEIATNLNGYTVVINKSTVPIGTGKKVYDIINKIKPEVEFDVASNPEFLREGSAINDFMRPDRVVIGCESRRARDILKELYRPLFLLETPILFTKRETAELIKYAANSFLATKITFINEIADLCEKVKADVSDVSVGIGLDGRIGKKFLHPGPGYGGSCFPKDTLALVKTAQDHGSPLKLIEHVVKSNKKRKERMYKKILRSIPKSDSPYVLAILGLTFKENCPDLRNTKSIEIINQLSKYSNNIDLVDPIANQEEAREIYGIQIHKKIPFNKKYSAILVLVGHNYFKQISIEEWQKLLNPDSVIFDIKGIVNKDLGPIRI